MCRITRGKREPKAESLEPKQFRGRVWDRPLFSELKAQLRLRQPRVFPHDLGVVQRIELVESYENSENVHWQAGRFVTEL